MGALSGEPGRSPVVVSLSSYSSRAGTSRRASSRRSTTGPTWTERSNPFSSTVAPDHHGPVGPRHQVAVPAVDQPSHRPHQSRGTHGGRQADGEALHRPDRRPKGVGHPSQLARAAAGGQHHGGGAEPATLPEDHPTDASGVRGHLGDLVVHEGHGAGPAGVEEGLDHSTVVHLMVLGQLDPPTDSRRQEGLGGPALPGREPAGGEPERQPVAEDVVDGLPVGGVDGHQKGARWLVVDRSSRRPLEVDGRNRARPGRRRR